MTSLSVNINKVALIRNSRGGNLPDVVRVAIDCLEFGADGITVHPRPDERHIRYKDIPLLRKAVTTSEFNIEGNPTGKFMDLVWKNAPDQCTLVPDPPGVLTSDTGWDTLKNEAFLSDIVARLHERNIRVSLFIDPDPKMVEGAKKVNADRVELYTGNYAKQYEMDREAAIRDHLMAASKAREVNIGLNAGHDLNLDNLRFYAERIPDLLEVSIGHALISDALYYGLENVIPMYQHLIKDPSEPVS
jgi:pyridoxine 5-phosphate synthase